MATLFMTSYTPEETSCTNARVKDSYEVEDDDNDTMNDDCVVHDDKYTSTTSATTTNTVASISDTALENNDDDANHNDDNDDFVIVDRPVHHLLENEPMAEDDDIMRTDTEHGAVAKLIEPKALSTATNSSQMKGIVVPNNFNNEIEATDLDEAFREVNRHDDDDDDDLFLPAQQTDTTYRIGDSRHTIEAINNEDDVRNCVSPVMNEVYDTKDDDDLTDMYSTPMSSPTYNNNNNTSTNTSTAIVTWPLPQYYPSTTWNVSSNSNSQVIDTTNVPYRGLYNLGNTCYMASALQMIGSIPFFIDLVRNETPHTAPSMDNKLRAAFLCLMDEITERIDSNRNCNTTDDSCSTSSGISPQTLKDTIDERTSLFTGYRQHDAHEFITTLLDLLDEDYKAKAKATTNNTSDDVAHDEETFIRNEEIMEDVVVVNEFSKNSFIDNTSDMDDDNDKSCGGELIVEAFECGDNDKIDSSETSTSSSCCKSSKKQKMDDSITTALTIADTVSDLNGDIVMNCSMSSSVQPTMKDNAVPCQSSRQCGPQSYSELDMSDIERLIHGTSHNEDCVLTQTSVPNMTTNSDDHDNYQECHHNQQQLQDSPSNVCKLFGGRMSTNDVILTPYGNDERKESSIRFPSLFHGSTLIQSQPQPHNLATTTQRNDTMGDANNQSDHESEIVQSPIDTTFTTEVRVRLTCDSCKFTRTHKETYLHLSLEIGSSTTTSDDDFYSMSDVDCSCGSNIEDGIRRFFAPCTQELKCEKCFCETATQSMEITKLPPVLLLHLKRFIVDYSSDWSSISYRKNESAVYLNDNLSVHNDSGALSEFLASDCSITSHMNHETTMTNKSFSLSSQMCTSTSKYVLRSVVNHIGSSANCGHYTADAQRGGEQSEWFRFNDACVTPISMTDAIEQSKQTAYMCLYELS